MAEVIPAILPITYRELKEKGSMLAGRVPLVHLDVTNASLTPESAWPYGDAHEWDEIQREEKGFPYWEEFNIEAHLMVRHVENVYEEWVKAGAERLIVHYEAFESSEMLSHFLRKLHERFSGPNEHLKIETGLAVNLETAIEHVLDHVLECDFIHLMSIAQLGSQGQAFEEAIFDKIHTLRGAYPETIISVDGGVNAENAQRLVDAGVDRLVVGSAIWRAEDPLEALNDLIIEAE